MVKQLQRLPNMPQYIRKMTLCLIRLTCLIMADEFGLGPYSVLFGLMMGLLSDSIRHLRHQTV